MNKMKKIIAIALFLSFLTSIAFAGPKKYSFVPSGEPQVLDSVKTTTRGKTSLTPILQITKFEKVSEGPWIIEGFLKGSFVFKEGLGHKEREAGRLMISFEGNPPIVLKKYPGTPRCNMEILAIDIAKPSDYSFSKTFTLKDTPVSGLIWLETYDPSKEPKEPIEPSTWQSF